MNAIIAFSLRLLFVILAYAFVGWTLFTIFKDLKITVSERSTKHTPPITLEFETETAKIQKSFEKSEIIIGRDPTSDLILGDERVSLRHCKLSYYQNQWWIEDLNSTNGTFLNTILISTNTVLTDRDLLQIGRIVLTVSLN
jgi:hypothetical protein